MSRVLGIVYRTLVTHLIRKAGFTCCTAYTGAVTLIQCFGGALRVIACIDDPVVIDKILSHLNKKTSFLDTNLPPESRAPPQRGLFD